MTSRQRSNSSSTPVKNTIDSPNKDRASISKHFNILKDSKGEKGPLTEGPQSPTSPLSKDSKGEKIDQRVRSTSLSRSKTVSKKRLSSKLHSSRVNSPLRKTNVQDLPPEDEIEREFEAIKAEFSLPEGISIDHRQKWTMVLQYYKHVASGERGSDEELYKILKKLSKGRKSVKPSFLLKVRTLLTSKQSSWVRVFSSEGGLNFIFDIFNETILLKKQDEKDSEIIAECVRSLKAIMNLDKYHFDAVMERENCIYLLVRSIEYLNTLSKAEIFELLAVVCLKLNSTNVWKEILTVGVNLIMDSFQSTNHELRVSTLVLVNGLLIGADDWYQYNQIFMLLEQAGFNEALTKIKNNFKDDLEWITQVSIFEEQASEQSQSREAQISKLNAQIKSLENVISNLVAKNAKLAEENDSLLHGSIPGKSDGDDVNILLRKLRDKDEIIIKLEYQIRALVKHRIDQGLYSNKINKVETPEEFSQTFTAITTIPNDVLPPPDLPPPPEGIELTLAESTPKKVLEPASQATVVSNMSTPPPPPGGSIEKAAPPPPPGMGMGIVKLPPKKKIVPEKKMKVLNWAKIAPNGIKNTVWEKINDEKIQLNAQEIEELFSVESATPATSAQLKKKEEKPQKITLLDVKRANNLEIMIRGMNMNMIEVRNAIKSMDENALSSDTIKALLNAVPTNEEIKIIEDYNGNKDDLGNAEKFVLTLGSIPLIGIRMHALEYKKSFTHKVKELETSLSTLKEALITLKDEKLFNILELVLAVGNHINGNTQRGGSYGFKISSLSKLMDVKNTKRNDATLLHYITELLQRDYSQQLNFIQQKSKFIQSASKENFQDLINETKKLESGLSIIKIQLESATCDQEFKHSMSSFVVNAESKVLSLLKLSETNQKIFKDLLIFYNEVPNVTTDEFFSNFSQFMLGTEKCIKDNEAYKQKQKYVETKIQNDLKPEHNKIGNLESMIQDVKSGRLFIERKATIKKSLMAIPSI